MIKFCLAKAAECRRKAEQAMDPSLQRSWRKMEGRWFFLARSYANELGRCNEDAVRKGMAPASNRDGDGREGRRSLCLAYKSSKVGKEGEG
jgi:hypothetical protein